MAQSPERRWRFDLSIFYHAPTSERRKLIAWLVTTVKGFEPGSEYHRYIVTNLSRNEGAQLDHVMKSCEAAIRKIQLDWPVCFPVPAGASTSQSWAVKFHNHRLEYLEKRRDVVRPIGGVVELRRLRPYVVVRYFDDAGMIIMN